MILALDKITCAALPNDDPGMRARRQAMREGIAQIWAVIASVIDCPELQVLTEQASFHIF
jgi:hypothetical protein